MKVLVIAGTRPEAIKIAPILWELRKYPHINTLLCSSGQHKQLIDDVFEDFGLIPDIKLDVMSSNQSLSSLSAKLFLSIDKVLDEECPDWIIVQGDTTTVMVSSLCAFYKKIKIAHIEAGLRSFDKESPFPEEINRQIVTRVADLHFAPTQCAYENLIKEFVDPNKVFITGNTVIDTLLIAKDLVKAKAGLLDKRVCQAIDQNKKIILITGHRRENFGHGFEQICLAIKKLTNTYKNALFVYPVHLNPNVKEPVTKYLGEEERVLLLEPQSYLKFQALLNASYLVLTDSGGIQEEAPFLGIPVVVMRDITERQEGIETGCAILAGSNADNIFKEVSAILDDPKRHHLMASAKNPYGEGNSAKKIVEAILGSEEK